jgi:hypothetical protein
MTKSSLMFRLGLSLICLLTVVGCLTPGPEYYTGRTADGRFYMAMAPRKHQFTPFGLVKLSKPKIPKIKIPDFSDTKPSDGSFWEGDGVSGSPRLHIDISDQMAYYYKGDKLVGASPVCTGSPAFPTPRGSFSVMEKDHDHLSSVYGDYIDKDKNILKTQIDNRKDPRPRGAIFDGAKMHWFMRVTGAVGMHEGYLPGYADSHGCIRLPLHMAKKFYEVTPAGTPVKITE